MSDEDIVAALANGMDHETWCNRAAPVLDDDDLACADNRVSTARLLLPIVRRVAEQRAAEELLAAAEESTHWVMTRETVHTRLNERAAALTASPNHGTDATT